MTFANNFVVVIKFDGKFHRPDENGNVKIPFGKPYSIYLKNFDSRDACVDILIDGIPIVKDTDIFIKGNSSADIKGFINKNGKVEHEFVFVKKTKDNIKVVGDRVEDGIISVNIRHMKRISEKIEKIHKVIDYDWDDIFVWPRRYYRIYYPHPWWPSWWKSPYFTTYSATSEIDSSFVLNDSGSQKEDPSILYSSSYSSYKDSNGNTLKTKDGEITEMKDGNPTKGEGITVRGDKINEQLDKIRIDENDFENISTTINIKLVGFEPKEQEKKPKTVRPEKTHKKMFCPNCGLKIRTYYKFCPECGLDL